MTREEEDRRLALSTAVAQINAAHDALDAIDWSRLPLPAHDGLRSARWHMQIAEKIVGEDLAALKRKAIDEMPEEHR